LSGIAYLQKGEGEDLLFLHGYLSNKEAWTAQTEYFSRFYRVTSIDIIGFGKSKPLPYAYSVDDYADWLQEVMQALKLSRPHLFAHSFGCRVAVKLSGRNDALFNKMLLTGPAGIIRPRTLKYKAKVKAYRVIKKFAPRYAETHFGSEEYRSLSPLMKESYKKIVNEDLRPCAQRTTNSVLIVEGTKDAVTPIEEAKLYKEAFPHAEIIMVEGGHFAFAENPVAFNLIAEEFLRGK